MNGYSEGFLDGWKSRDEKIVRCADCKHWKGHSYDTAEVWCNMRVMKTMPSFYCADGERKKEVNGSV